MLNQVHFENIKSLADVTIDLERLTVLVGPNGCGKSTVLDQVDVFCKLAVGTNAVPMVPQEISLRANSKSGSVWRGRTSEAQVEFSRELREGSIFSVHNIGVQIENLKTKGWFNPFGLSSFGVPEISNLRSLRLRLDRAQVATPAPLILGQPLRPDGYGLASLLADMRINDPDRCDRIEHDLHAVVPQFERFYFTRAQVMAENPQNPNEKTAQVGYALDLSFRGVGRVAAHQASDGTLLALALLTAVHAHELPNLVLIDDIDHGLHLSAQYTLIKAIRGVMEARPELQILCTSHAPVLLDSFDVKEVRVMALDKDGATRVRPLSEAPGFERLSRGMGTGEIWASLGEDWVLNDE